MSKSNVVYIPPKTKWQLSDSPDNDGTTFVKELIYAGEFRQGDGKTFEVNEVVLDHWERTFKAMGDNGVSVPLPLRHTEDPEANRGQVTSMTRRDNKDGVPALFAQIKFRDKEAAELAKTANVSIMSPPEFVDGKGNRYVRPIRHVALTDYPVIPGLQGFESIAASFYDPTNKEAVMPLLDLTKKLNITCDDEAKAEGAIVAAFETQATTIEEREQDIADRDTSIETLKKQLPSDPIKVIASHRSMLRDNREMKLDRLVGTKISPAVKTSLLEIFCSDDQLNLVLSQENADDSFDKIVAALGKNEIVELSGELSGPQGGIPLDKTTPAENPLLADAKKRAAAS